MEPWCHVDYDVDKLYFRPTSRCLGGRAAHAPLMQYERQLLRNYVGVPRISWQARTGHAATPTGSDLASGPPTFKPPQVYLEGHEPSYRLMGNLDADLAAHLLQLRAAHGERTAVFIVSDHGIHYGKYYDRAQAGPREHALPLAYARCSREARSRAGRRWLQHSRRMNSGWSRPSTCTACAMLECARACTPACALTAEPLPQRRCCTCSRIQRRPTAGRGGGPFSLRFRAAAAATTRECVGDAGVGVGVRINFVAIRRAPRSQ